MQRFETPRPTLKTINFLLFDHIGGLNTLLHTLFNKGTVVAPKSRSVEDNLETCADKYYCDHIFDILNIYKNSSKMTSISKKNDPKMTPKSTPKLSQEASRGPEMPCKTGPRFSICFLTSISFINSTLQSQFFPLLLSAHVHSRFRLSNRHTHPPSIHVERRSCDVGGIIAS